MWHDVHLGESRDAAEFVEASTAHHPVDDLEPVEIEDFAREPRNRLRLELAKALFNGTGRSLADIARDCGCNRKYASRILLRITDAIGLKSPHQRPESNRQKCREARAK